MALAPDGRLVIECVQDGRRRRQVVEFSARGEVRLTQDDDDSFGLLLIDGLPYFFGASQGQPVVVDLLAGAARAQSPAATAPTRTAPHPRKVVLERTGRFQSEAGIEGEWARIETCDADGSRSVAEALVARDPRLAPMIASLAAALHHDTGVHSFTPLVEQLIDRGLFALRAEGHRLLSAAFEPLPDARFALPAPPCAELRLMFQVVMAAAKGVTATRPPSAGSRHTGETS